MINWLLHPAIATALSIGIILLIALFVALKQEKHD